MLVVLFRSRFGPRRRAAQLSVLCALVSIAACSSDTVPSAPHELDGASVAVGQGSAHTFVIDGPDGPSSIGVAMTPASLNSLPPTDTMWDLPLPSGVSVAPFDHVTINWNAHGHPPAVYGLPHFDFHFYTISVLKQAAIQGGPDTVTVPAADVPTDYVTGVDAVPDMGVHWADTTAAEFHGQMFDRTLIYGFYHGSLVFIEPMITSAFLSTEPDVTAQVKQPQEFVKPGRYPTSYSVRMDHSSNTIRVSLASLVAR